MLFRDCSTYTAMLFGTRPFKGLALRHVKINLNIQTLRWFSSVARCILWVFSFFLRAQGPKDSSPSIWNPSFPFALHHSPNSPLPPGKVYGERPAKWDELHTWQLVICHWHDTSTCFVEPFTGSTTRQVKLRLILLELLLMSWNFRKSNFIPKSQKPYEDEAISWQLDHSWDSIACFHSFPCTFSER